jgi:hypothetical protein
MLDRFRESNKKNNITGSLLYYRGMFIQYIEGNRANVLNLFEKIKKDKLHSRVILLSTSDIYIREFDTWDMAYMNITHANHQFAYLKLMTSLFKETNNTVINRNYTSKTFWTAVKNSLKS